MPNKFAIVQVNHTQYKVSVGDTIKVHKLPGEAGDKIKFDKILLLADGDKVTIGKPYIEKKSIDAEILEQTKGPKVVKEIYKAKSRYRRKVGHRQDLTVVKINKF